MIVIDVLVYLFCVIGSAVLLNYSTLYSPIQDKIKDSILELIARPTNSRGYGVIQSIQESVSIGNSSHSHLNRGFRGRRQDWIGLDSAGYQKTSDLTI